MQHKHSTHLTPHPHTPNLINHPVTTHPEQSECSSFLISPSRIYINPHQYQPTRAGQSNISTINTPPVSGPLPTIMIRNVSILMTRSSITCFRSFISAPYFVTHDIFSNILPQSDQVFNQQFTSDPLPPTGIARRPTPRPHLSFNSNQYYICPLDTTCAPYGPCQ